MDCIAGAELKCSLACTRDPSGANWNDSVIIIIQRRWIWLENFHCCVIRSLLFFTNYRNTAGANNWRRGHRKGGRQGAKATPGFWNLTFSCYSFRKKVVFLVSRSKQNFPYFWPHLKNNFGYLWKTPLFPSLEKILPVPMTGGWLIMCSAKGTGNEI